MSTKPISLRRRSMLGRRHAWASQTQAPFQRIGSELGAQAGNGGLIHDADRLPAGSVPNDIAENGPAIRHRAGRGRAVAAPGSDDAPHRPATAASDQSQAAQLSRKFVAFAGSGANARALVAGLRCGRVIALDWGEDDRQAARISFVPPTGALRYGHIFIVLAMAEQLLAAAGVAKPTPRQICTALTGGVLFAGEAGCKRASFVPGVLHLRCRGLDWRGIAKAHALGLPVATGTGEDGSGRGRPPARALVPATGAGCTMLFACLGLALALATLPGMQDAAWAGDGAMASTPQPSALFRKLDADHDGTVSRGEAARQKNFLKAFDEADERHRGRLGVEEFAKAESIYQREQAEGYLDDSVITARVKAQLLKDPAVAALEVGVETYRGRVLLSGFVDSPAQIRRAERIASAVRGVQSVHNNLFIK